MAYIITIKSYTHLGKTKTQCVGIDCPMNFELVAEEILYMILYVKLCIRFYSNYVCHNNYCTLCIVYKIVLYMKSCVV